MVGRAPARQCWGRRFKSRSSKFFFVHPKYILLTVTPGRLTIIPGVGTQHERICIAYIKRTCTWWWCQATPADRKCSQSIGKGNQIKYPRTSYLATFSESPCWERVLLCFEKLWIVNISTFLRNFETNSAETYTHWLYSCTNKITGSAECGFNKLEKTLIIKGPVK